MQGFRRMKTAVKFDVPCNPWMNCKALLAGTAPALGNAVLSLAEIHRWDCPAVPRLWMPGALPGLCVCQASTSWPGTEPGRTTLHPALALHWGKSRNTNKTRKVVHSTGSLVWTVEGAGNVQNVPAVLLAPGWDMWGRLSARCGIAGEGSHTFLCFCLPSRVSALTQPGGRQQHHSLTVPACCVTQCRLHFHALLLYSTNRESFLLRQQSVQSYQNDPKQKPPRTTKENSGCTKQAYTVNSVVWITYQPFSTSTLCALAAKGIRKHSKRLSLTLRG